MNLKKNRMNKRNFIIAIILAAFVGAFVALTTYKVVNPKDEHYNSIQERQNVKLSNYNLDDVTVPEGLNFIEAAKLVTPGVVGVTVTKKVSGEYYFNPFERLFGNPHEQMPEQDAQAAGSGVIISDDGYIATNYHVVEGADKIEVVLHDNRRYKAELIGSDPTTDLALIKIPEKNLTFIRYGDSDKLKVGEWVLAVGNPFALTSTVTAGIISAKARNISILQDRGSLSIESFLQTDAAVNPGNSGGALVNLKGELVGINTAIASNTGSYAGYSFAVPVSLVKKVMDDLLEYGTVQRALLGISIQDVSVASKRLNLNLDESTGVYVASVNKGSAAEEAGIKEGDIITAINNNKVENTSELQEYVARNRPGDKIDVTFMRDGKEKEVTATLKNIMGEEKMYSRDAIMEIQGATVSEIDKKTKEKLDIKGGVQLENIHGGKWADAGIKDGYIITSVDKIEVKTVNDLMASLANKSGGILIGGVYPDGEEVYYGVKW
jgi:Do/DeqQ family serine protease